MSEKEKTPAETLIDELAVLKERRQEVQQVWEEISQYVIPRRGGYDPDAEPKNLSKEILGRKIYDTTAAESAQLLADGLMGYQMSPATTWFRMEYQNKRLNRDPMARRYIQGVEETLYSLLNHSDYYQTMSEVIADGVGPGTAGMSVEADYQHAKLVFTAHHPKEIFLVENRLGLIDTVFRVFWMQRREVLKQFGKDAVDQEFLNKAKESPLEEVQVLHAVRPRTERLDTIDVFNKPWASHYILVKEKRLLRESGFDRMPYVIWRWLTVAGDEYGRSPTWTVLPMALRANQIARTQIRSAQLHSDPTVLYPAELAGQFEIIPGGMMPYTDPSRILKTMSLGGNYPLGATELDRIQKQIRDIYRVDFFLLLTQLAAQARTATEVNEMQGEKAAILGTIMGRLNSELVSPVIANSYFLAARAGWIEKAPDVVLDTVGSNIQVQYLGPLAQAQKRYYTSQGATSALNELAPIAQLYPEVLMTLNPEELARHILHGGGMPEKIMRTPKEIAAIQAQMQQQQAAEQQQQQLLSAAQAYAQTTKAGEAGTPAHTIAQQLRGAF